VPGIVHRQVSGGVIKRVRTPTWCSGRRDTRSGGTHDIEELVKVAGLRAERDADAPVNSALWRNWQVVKDWSEAARYQR
jgi:hypothetical protein